MEVGAGHTDTAEASSARRVLEALLVVGAPLLTPFAQLLGAFLVARRRPRGWLATLTMSPFGLLLPLWLYGHGSGDGAELAPMVALPAATLLTVGCFVATWRLVGR